MPSGPRPKSGKRLEVEAAEAPTAPWTMDALDRRRRGTAITGEIRRRSSAR